MEISVGKNTVPISVINNTCRNSLIDSSDNMYYDLAAFADIYSISLIPKMSHSTSTVAPENLTNTFNKAITFRPPECKFPTFSRSIVEWLGFKDLFQSILLHAPGISDVEHFECLKI